jgi:hypothetical protein
MAQYTTILAEEYNVMRRTMAKVLGRISFPSTYGYNVPGQVVSSEVLAGMTIQNEHFENLQADINTARYWQVGSVPAITSPVAGNIIYWSNIVAYQNAVNAAESSAASHVWGQSNGLTETNTGVKNQGPWGGPAGNTGYGYAVIQYQTSITFSDAWELQAFLNLGGFIQPQIYTDSVGTTGKDIAFRYVIGQLNSININWSRWWNNLGGASGVGTTYSVSASSEDSASYSPYNTPSRRITGTIAFTWDSDRVFKVSYNFYDYDIGTSTNGYTTPGIADTTSVIVRAFYPNGSAPPSPNLGSAIVKSAPTFSATQGFDNYWF